MTGGSRGLGSIYCKSFAKEGANVVVNFFQNKEKAEEVANSIEEMNRRALVIQADISDLSHVENMVKKTLDEFGRIDVLINNAGINIDSTVRKMDKETWDRVIDVNLNGTFNCCKTVIDTMRNQRSGRIINVTSVVGQMGVIGASNYAASKAGIIGFTKALAKEVARSNITVNAIALGYINIGMLKRLPQKFQDLLLSQIPLGRFGKPEEVAQTVLFLASEGAGYITGQIISINGGFYM